jgi:hypothetical protein
MLQYHQINHVKKIYNKIMNTDEIITPEVMEQVVESTINETPVMDAPVTVAPMETATVQAETPIADVVIPENVALQVGEGWTITVSTKGGEVVQKFADVSEALRFANANGYTLHAE